MKRWVIFCFLLQFINIATHAQQYLSIGYGPSKVYKHKETLLFDVPSYTQEFKLSYLKRTSGDQYWHQYWKRPKLGISFGMVDFGSPELGKAYSLLPEIHFYLIEKKRFSFQFQFGVGVAYLDNPFDPLDNPKNNAIGSNLNNCTAAKFALSYNDGRRWSFSLAPGLVHFSNGRTSTPNSGINIYGITAMANYRIGKMAKEKEAPSILQREKNRYKKWVLDAGYEYGLTEHTVYGGPKYGIQTYSVGIGYRYSEFMTAVISASYEYNDAIYVFYRNNFMSESFSKNSARSKIISVENEFRYGSIINRLTIGFYIDRPETRINTFFTKILTGYSFPVVFEKVRPYAGVVLKTHLAKAEYLGLDVGVTVTLF